MATAPAPARERRDEPGRPTVPDYGPPHPPAWLGMDWAPHLRTLEIEGRRVNLVDIGEGPPLLLIHGHSGRWQNWLENILDLRRTHRVVAVDLPGFGESEMPKEKISIQGYARTVDAVCDRLEIDAAEVVGNSMGGFVSAELAISFPYRVERLVLVAAAGLAGRYIGLPTALLGNPTVVTAGRLVFAYSGMPRKRARKIATRPGLRRAYLRPVMTHPELIPPATAYHLIRSTGRPGMVDATLATATYDFRDRVQEIACPTLVIWGDTDRVVPVSGADDYEELISDSRKVILKDTGHIPMVERPKRFSELLQEFDAERPHEDMPDRRV
jgi:pimeloyl-ACP methyl ester carboxylesterase